MITRAPKLDQTLAVLNGLLGDYLVRTDNGLATELGLYCHGLPVSLTSEELATTYPNASARVCVLVHGVMSTEALWRFPETGEDYGSLLARDLGYTPCYVRYNSGRPIADNGLALSQLLAELVAFFPTPVTELLLVGYSMGGLLIRSACHFGAESHEDWLPLVQRAIYVGTPHSGAPAERVGRVVAKLLTQIPDPYTRLVAEIGNLRSSGLRDLGDADLRHEDRLTQADRLSLRDARHPVPLLASIRHHLIAGTWSSQAHLAALFGDTLVSVASATARHMRLVRDVVLPPEQIKVLPGIGHIGLAHHPAVYAEIKAWVEATS
jgi:triacylglycerol lipase